MRQTFQYRPRSLRDQVVRENQTRDEVDKAPKIEPEILCTRSGCGHPRWAHCDVRRSAEKRTVLFVARHHGGQYLWTRVHGYSASLSGYSLAQCRHFTEGQPDFPLCSSSACSCRGCICASFQSPYKKQRKPATKATGAGTRKRRKEIVGQAELFEGL